jgi:hypothetical protein
LNYNNLPEINMDFPDEKHIMRRERDNSDGNREKFIDA